MANMTPIKPTFVSRQQPSKLRPQHASHLQANRTKPAVLQKPLTVREQIIRAFHAEFGISAKATQDKHVLWLFNYFSRLIIQPNWKYEPNIDKHSKILDQNSSTQFVVNCYDLSWAFMAIVEELGMNPKNIGEVVHLNKMSKPLGESHDGVFGPFLCFDATKRNKVKSPRNCFLFRRHCYVKINKHYYDLTFLSHFDYELDIFDDSLKAEIFNTVADDSLLKLQRLLEKSPNFDINALGPNGKTLLHFAAKNNNVQMAKFLLDLKINPNIADDNKECAIHGADDLDSDIFALLAEPHCTDPKITMEIRSNYTNNVQLKMSDAINAIQENMLEKLKKLLTIWKLDINQKDEGGFTLLHWAVVHSNMDAIQFLLQRKANANIQDNSGFTPLDYVTNPESEIFELLSKPEHTDPRVVQRIKESFKPLKKIHDKISLAAEAIKEANVEKISAILIGGLDINAQDFEGWTLLHWAVMYDVPEIAQFLIKLGAINIKSKKDSLPSELVVEGYNKRDWRFLEALPVQNGVTLQSKQECKVKADTQLSAKTTAAASKTLPLKVNAQPLTYMNAYRAGNTSNNSNDNVALVKRHVFMRPTPHKFTPYKRIILS